MGTLRHSLLIGPLDIFLLHFEAENAAGLAAGGRCPACVNFHKQGVCVLGSHQIVPCRPELLLEALYEPWVSARWARFLQRRQGLTCLCHHGPRLTETNGITEETHGRQVGAGIGA